MRDIGGFIWIVFVLFAVISSIVKSARRSRGAPASVNTQGNRPAATPARPAVMVQFHQQAQPVVQPRPVPQPPRVVQPPPQAAPQPVPPPAQAVPRLVVPPPQPELRPKAFFADRDALVRGIIAGEVLGKPLALRDE